MKTLKRIENWKVYGKYFVYTIYEYIHVRSMYVFRIYHLPPNQDSMHKAKDVQK